MNNIFVFGNKKMFGAENSFFSAEKKFVSEKNKLVAKKKSGCRPFLGPPRPKKKYHGVIPLNP